MPTYCYHCPNCELEFKAIRAMTDPEVNTCPECATPSKRDYSIGRINFKGDGFYSTDKAE